MKSLKNGGFIIALIMVLVYSLGIYLVVFKALFAYYEVVDQFGYYSKESIITFIGYMISCAIFHKISIKIHNKLKYYQIL